MPDEVLQRVCTMTSAAPGSAALVHPCRNWYVRRPYRLRDKRHGQKALQDMMVLHEPLFGGLDMQRCRNISATPMLLYTFT
ncbi:hypothetical protein ABBQ32_011458 [Trebouxia sp. C0010 RCD-2024]